MSGWWIVGAIAVGFGIAVLQILFIEEPTRKRGQKRGTDEMMAHAPGPWEYVASTEHHGPYVEGPHGGTICDFYTMSKPTDLSVRNGGESKPLNFFGDLADGNARLTAAAPALLEACEEFVRKVEAGEARSKCSYAQMKSAIALAKGDK